jgi:hypothetical protein
MENTEIKFKIAKCDKQELENVRNYLQELDNVIKDNEHYEEDDQINKEIADIARKYPARAFLIPLNLAILLDNYQDEDSDFLQHPKWIVEMINLLKEIDQYLSSNNKNYVGSGSILHTKIKNCLIEND